MNVWNIEAPKELKDGIESFLFDEGVTAISEEELNPGQVRLTLQLEEPEFERNCSVYLSSLQELFPELPAAELRAGRLENNDWLFEYRKYFKPQQISQFFFLKPPWEKVKVPDHLFPIVIEPGLAFGTGIHESTQIALNLIEQARFESDEIKNFGDVGCGTGILSIAMRHLGIQKGYAVDTCFDSIEATLLNLKENQIEGVQTILGSVDQIPEPIDLLVANILLGTHLELLPEYVKKLGAQSRLILSGLLTSQKEALLEGLSSHGLHMESWFCRREWMGCTVKLAT